jgi:pimeloyl-[acyl-carrier protein] synthase
MKRFDPLAPQVLPDPYPHYAQLRRVDPIHWGLADDAGLPGRWYITCFDDVTAILKDSRFGREIDKVLPSTALPPIAEEDRPLHQMADGWMILRDPPAHTRLRGLVSNFFTPRRVNELRPQIETTAHRLIDQMIAAGPPLDLLAHYTLPLTVLLTAHVLGLPGEEYDRLMPWSRALAAAIDFNQEPGTREASRRAVAEFSDYLRDLVAARRRQPQDDLISALVATGKGAGAEISEAERFGTITHLLFVGNDPVMHQIGLAVYTLLRHPDQLALLRANPGLLANAVDELLRYDSSVQATFRYALADVELHGKQIRTGDHIAVMLAAANRDPACCPDPDRLDIARPVGQVATFGAGVHYCLGAPLARLEGQIGLGLLLERLPGLALATEQLEWQPTIAVRGPVRLPVSF